MRLRALLVLAAVAASACAGSADRARGETVRLLFAGDVMLGRGVARVLEADGPEALEAIRFAVGAADLAVANLESPLTTRPYAGGGHDLRADPGAAGMLAGAGFDALAIANNHAGDGGPGTVADTVAALEQAGVAALGEPSGVVTLDRKGLRVALLAYDLTGGGPPDDVAVWSAAAARESIGAARAAADIVAVGIHGGVEGLPGPDPALVRAVRDAAGWGADVVWAHGAHVAYQVEVVDAEGDGRPTVAAFGLGDLVFDRSGTGLLLEVIAGEAGVEAWRVGESAHADGRPGPPRWRDPSGPAAAVGGGWWALTDRLRVRRTPPAPIVEVGGEVLAAARGDLDGDGVDEALVSFLRPFRETLVNQAFEGIWVDDRGRSAHLGVYRWPSLEPVWIAGTLPRPVLALAACDGGLAVAYGEPGAPPEAVGAWQWNRFGFTVTSDLPGAGRPGCADVDRDGRADAVIWERTP